MSTRRSKPGNPKGTTTRDYNAAQRARTALQMRAQGKSYDDIAAAAGYGNRGAAHKAVQRELARVVVEDVQELRREQLEKLRMLEEECWKVLYDKKEKGRMFQIERIVSILERQARLLGLDAPTNGNVFAAQVIVREAPSGLLGTGEAK